MSDTDNSPSETFPGIPYMLVFGHDEMGKKVVKVKNVQEHSEVEVGEEAVVAELLRQGCCPIVCAERGFLEALSRGGAGNGV